MKKRILTLLFAALLCASSLISCSGGETETTAETTADTAAVETEAETDSLEARKLVDDGLADKDFGGEDFRMLYQERYAEFQYVEEMTGRSPAWSASRCTWCVPYTGRIHRCPPERNF